MPRNFRFGPFELDTHTGEVSRRGIRVRLPDKPLQVLTALLERPGDLVTRDELRRRLWTSDTFVDFDHGLNTALSRLREVLSDSAGQPRYIETIPKRGYRFLARVECNADPMPRVVPALQQRQEIRFCTTADGVRIAFATIGQGRPLVKAANWLNHLEFEWASPVWHHWIAELSRSRTFIRYDERGNGMSDWHVPGMTFEAWVRDLETIVEAANVTRFDLLALSQGAAVAIAYAVRHPERVSHLVLCGGYSRGWHHRGRPEAVEARHALETLVRLDWGKDLSSFSSVFTSLYIPENSSLEHQSWFNELQRTCTSPENAAQIMAVCDEINVRSLLPLVAVPTLVFHCDGDRVVPFEEGKILAAEIPNAKFVPLASSNHILLEQEPAWRVFTHELGRFLAAPAA